MAKLEREEEDQSKFKAKVLKLKARAVNGEADELEVVVELAKLLTPEWRPVLVTGEKVRAEWIKGNEALKGLGGAEEIKKQG
ncbi:hypothetical protein A3A76_01125 [Candidatus Woesebacteria bacterium RIFCSPLOWO2_01_FULL_39_23]|uniref:Uncharacterized protein n=1 Tax=Candidatus Woesebacteria bacterium RIFCSPHIGHO2_01_FULL_40_22 TaxID=1802499 RepID=A0A1F7YEU3_9BACT|nr:MAG: hypothetical protein A2141_04725 [Candidatus Woesebacteria bacterium RBG_16_40_11]OGM25864.1 MAG: hypothetical protein A2628_04800 [Candidatus Woesebacteria bacterium RIFCSPHIGHO2_01_FULL_40_22]OGM36242.1 MAG: hypothetical protein A3E41_02530 [Candidatus Woesebacteria bacterium RIFCSPHIGHO2_12_FULL_38_9]OGM61618.1 MAG: hypothetical protein A3A76_01125 [Candidatus Woesebacteria bacterium RIFCSPLOWO2_01_FULL_39_23]